MHAIDAVNRWGALGTTLAGSAVWQSTLVALAVAVAALALRRSSPAAQVLAVANRGDQAARRAALELVIAAGVAAGRTG